jgi:hypothetical protein
MSEDKKVTKKKIIESAPEIPKVDEKEAMIKFQDSLIARLEGFEKRMESLQEENKLLNQQMKLKDQLGQNPLSYASGVEKKKIEAPNILPSYSEKLLRAMEEDAAIVEGRFEFKEITNPKEAKGATVTFHYRKYPSEPVVTYTIKHNEVRQLPLGVAKHINGELGACKYSIHKHVMDKQGVPKIDMAGESVHRMGFHSTKFL